MNNLKLRLFMIAISIFIVFSITVSIMIAYKINEPIPLHKTPLYEETQTIEVFDDNINDNLLAVGQSNANTKPYVFEKLLSSSSKYKNRKIKGIEVVEGVDFNINGDDSIADIAIDVQNIVENFQKYKMDTIILSFIDNNHYASEQLEYDILNEFLINTKDKDICVFLKYDLSVNNQEYSKNHYDEIYYSLGTLISGYPIDGIILDEYCADSNQQLYSEYVKDGFGIDFKQYGYSRSTSLLDKAIATIKEINENLIVALSVSDVWANKNENNTDGSNTNAQYEMLYDGLCDVKNYIEQSDLDYIYLNSTTSTEDEGTNFNEVIAFWNNVAKYSNMGLYVNHEQSKLETKESGFENPNQIMLQISQSIKNQCYSGSSFNSYSSFIANTDGSTDALMNLFDSKMTSDDLLSELTIVTPEETNFTTDESKVSIRGSSDPNFPLTINNQEIPRDEEGFFLTQQELDIGSNSFTISHKGKEIPYEIEREFAILKYVYPDNQTSVMGDSKLKITAIGTIGVSMVAKLGEQEISLTQGDAYTSDAEDAINDTEYVVYEGYFDIPPSQADNSYILGTIEVFAQWEEFEKTLKGATVKVVKPQEIDSGTLVQVISHMAETFPTDTIDTTYSNKLHPLPKGTIDKVISEELVYSDGQKEHKYYLLASGFRVRSEDIEVIEDTAINENEITDNKISKNNDYTFLTINTDWKVPYSVTLDKSQMTIDFKYTSKVTKGKMVTNTLFSKASWTGSAITLEFKDEFYGYQVYYDTNDALVFRFNNKPDKLEGLKIVIDPGHSDTDTGALGFKEGYHERDINRMISDKVVAILTDLGAEVLLIDTSGGKTIRTRVDEATSFNAKLYLSIHNNSSVTNPNAQGCESYYFYDFSSRLSQEISKEISLSSDFINRGAKFGEFYVTRQTSFASALVECGFISNISEYERLLDDATQEKIAAGIVEGVKNFYDLE